MKTEALRKENDTLRGALEWVLHPFSQLACECGEESEDWEEHADTCPEYVTGYIENVLEIVKRSRRDE